MWVKAQQANDEYIRMSSKRLFKISIVICVLGFIILVVGIILLVVGIQRNNDGSSKDAHREIPASCEYTNEAKRTGFDLFLDKVKSTVYELHPHNIFYDPDVYFLPWEEAVKQVKANFKALDLSALATKIKTDVALELLYELNNMSVNLDKLLLRERRAYFRVKHYIEHVFGQQYDAGFYTGVWMLGPDSFCNVPICFLDYSLLNALDYYKPEHLSDVEDIKSLLLTFSVAIDRYIDNLKMGVLRGMVRNTESCKAGINALERLYLKISLLNETGRSV